MKVAYVSFAPFISGAERSLQVMLEWAPRVGIEPLVLCPPGSKITAWCEARGIPFRAVPLPDRDKRHPFRWLTAVARVALLLRREGVEIVHSNQVWSFATASAAAGLLGIPRVCHMRDEVSPEATRWWCKSGVELVICISEHIERLVKPAWGGEPGPRIHTAINPVVTPQETVPTSSPGRHGLHADVDEKATVLGFIGQIVAVKGLRELLSAAATVSSHQPWHLLIAGRDPHPGQPYEAECRALVTRLGLERRVSFLGYLEDTTEFYRAIDVAVVPSLQEPLGRIPLEAAVHGKPAIAFATGGLPETIVDGETGWLVPTGDVDSLLTALERVIDEPAMLGDLGRQARQHVRDTCAPDRYMERLATLYHTLLVEAGVSPRKTRLRSAVRERVSGVPR